MKDFAFATFSVHPTSEFRKHIHSCAQDPHCCPLDREGEFYHACCTDEETEVLGREVTYLLKVTKSAVKG